MNCEECHKATTDGNEYKSICNECLNGFRAQVGMPLAGKMEPLSGPIRRYLQSLINKACEVGHPPPRKVMRELGSKGFEVPIEYQVKSVCVDVGPMCLDSGAPCFCESQAQESQRREEN